MEPFPRYGRIRGSVRATWTGSAPGSPAAPTPGAFLRGVGAGSCRPTAVPGSEDQAGQSGSGWGWLDTGGAGVVAPSPPPGAEQPPAASAHRHRRAAGKRRDEGVMDAEP